MTSKGDTIKPTESSHLLDSFRGAKILVTGHTGFTGRWLTLWLDELGAEIAGVSLDEAPGSSLFEGPGVPISEQFLDIANFSSLVQSFEFFKPDLVIHLAAQSLVISGYEDPLTTYRTNTLGTAHVVQACLDVESVKGAIIVTTDKVYAESDVAHDESSLLGGVDPYSSSKAAAEDVVSGYRSLAKKRSLVLSVIRGGNIVGGGDWSKDRLIPDLVKAWTKGSVLELRNPDATRPWQHVLDLCYAYLLVGARILTNKGLEVDTAFNVGPTYASPINVRKVVELLSIQGLDVQVKVSKSKNWHESPSLSLRSIKLSNAVGWEGKWFGERAIKETAWWYEQRFGSKESPHSLAKRQIASYREGKD